MVRKWPPVVPLAAALGVLAWIASILPLGPGSANAESSLRLPRLSTPSAPALSTEDRSADQPEWARDEDEDERYFVARDEEDDEDGDDEDGDDENRGGNDGDDDDDEEWDEDGEYDEEEEEWEAEEIERELMYLEIRRAEIQAAFGELELVREVAEIVDSPVATASLVIIEVTNEVDDPEDKIEMLNDLIDVAKSDAVKRLILLKLAEVYGDVGRDEDAYKVVRRLVSEG